ncbi:MAG: hypothetical protein ABFD29_03885 [Anaerolineaceae bacterium]
MSNKQFFIDRARALSYVQGKPCFVCGQPSSCVVDGEPSCLEHAIQAQKNGRLVAFPPRKAWNFRIIKNSQN